MRRVRAGWKARSQAKSLSYTPREAPFGESSCSFAAPSWPLRFAFRALPLHRRGTRLGTNPSKALAGAEDGSLLLLRYPGDILRSTDTGGTWQVVYRGGFRVSGIGYSGNAILGCGDSSHAVVSYDSGRSWSQFQGIPPPDSLLEKEREYNNSPYPIPHTLNPIPYGTNAVAFADSAWWAVGEPGLICRWDGTKWRELHRAPFREDPVGPGAVGPEAPTYANVAFSSQAHGAIAVGNRVYLSNDSAVTWSETIVPDTSAISSMFLLSDSVCFLGMTDGRLYYASSDVLTRIDSILNSGAGLGIQPLRNTRPILEIGWKDKLDGNLFVLTDSILYSLRADLGGATVYSIPLAAGERAVAACFPDAYTGFLLTDSTRFFDTIATDGRDTTLIFNTCKIYRSLNGGATWNVALNNIPGLKALYFRDTKTGYASGASGLILHTEDTGSHWARAWTHTPQTIRTLAFAANGVGYAAGDSGTMLLTQTAGRFWLPVPPEPLFEHPSTSYTGVAFPDEHRVFVTASDRAWRGKVQEPVYWRPHWERPVRHTLSITEHPNPSNGQVNFEIHGVASDGFQPEVRICDLGGTTLSEVSYVLQVIPGEWTAEADVSFLTPGPYTAVAMLNGEQALCKFIIEH